VRACVPTAGHLSSHLCVPQWSDPLLHSKYVRQHQPTVDWLIPAPYVDNGEAHNLSSLDEKWAAEHRLAFGHQRAGRQAGHDGAHLHRSTRDAPVGATLDSHGPRGAMRNISIFFGGRTSTRIGPGHAQMGYYARWALMRSWAHVDKWAAHADLGSVGSGGGRGFEHVLIVDSDRGK
jgi:hypothetical protein